MHVLENLLFRLLGAPYRSLLRFGMIPLILHLGQFSAVPESYCQAAEGR